MRDKYIELIKEYIKEKPQYELAIDELKAEVLKVGATELEFEEAIRQISEPLINSTRPTTAEVSFTARYLEKSLKLAKVAKFHIETKKKYVAAISFVFILLISINVFSQNKDEKNKNVKEGIVAQAPDTRPPAKKDVFPVVYANETPVDAEKIFSVKSSNVRLTVTGRPKKEVLGFFPYWMISKQDKINLETLTSISLFGLDVDKKGNILTGGSDQANGGWSMWKSPEIDALIKRAKLEGLRVYLTLKSFDNTNIENLSQSDEAQKNFIANAIYLVNSKNLDGINIDFESTNRPTEAVREGFTRLIENLNSELKRQMPNAILTIDTYLVSGSDNGLFNIPSLAKNSDAFIIMGYDMHTPLGEPGPVSAMGGATNIVGYVQNYLEKVDASKLILAIPYYGYDWPQQGSTREAVNILPYAQIALQSKNLQLSWDETSQTPYFSYKDSQAVQRVVHFDNVRSLSIKYDFINAKNLKGVGIWALGYDGENQDLQKLLVDKFINQ